MISKTVVSQIIEYFVFLQAVACELIVEMTGKRDRATAIISSGMDVLKQLYRSKDDTIKARALVVSAIFHDVRHTWCIFGFVLRLSQYKILWFEEV